MQALVTRASSRRRSTPHPGRRRPELGVSSKGEIGEAILLCKGRYSRLGQGVENRHQEAATPTYLLEVSYTLEGAKGLRAEGGSSRAAAVTSAAESIGGKPDCFYFAFGGNDAYLIVDYPDNVTAAGTALAVTAAGGAKVRTVVLLTAADVDAAANVQSTHRAPGG